MYIYINKAVYIHIYKQIMKCIERERGRERERGEKVGGGGQRRGLNNEYYVCSISVWSLKRHRYSLLYPKAYSARRMHSWQILGVPEHLFSRRGCRRAKPISMVEGPAAPHDFRYGSFRKKRTLL